VDSKFGSSWAGGVLLSLLERLRWGYGRILEKVGRNFRVIQDLR
jgi:hypothetical protein